MQTTYIAECFWPDVRQDEIALAAQRIRTSTSELSREGRRVGFTGSMLIPRDDVVFYLFDGDSAEAVREACERAAIPFERVVESIGVWEEGLR